jgi:hypothetical protein
MQLARLVGGLAVLLAGAAFGAQGDALLVTGSNVNVRAGPSTEAGVLTRVGLDEPAIERRRQGEWVEVELPDQDVLGWIHNSLLASAPDRSQGSRPEGESGNEIAALGPAAPDAGARAAAATDVAATAAADADEGSPLSRFRREVEYFNDRAVAVAGVDLFTDVAPLGEGGVQVVTTEAWATMPEPGQQSYMNALFGAWQAAAGADQALRLEIIDSNGALMMEKSGP